MRLSVNHFTLPMAWRPKSTKGEAVVGFARIPSQDGISGEIHYALLERDLILQPVENAVLADFEVGAGTTDGISFKHGGIKRHLALVRLVVEPIPTCGVFPCVAEKSINLRDTSVYLKLAWDKEVTCIDVEAVVKQIIDAR